MRHVLAFALAALLPIASLNVAPAAQAAQAPDVDIAPARGHWLTRDLVAFDAPKGM